MRTAVAAGIAWTVVQLIPGAGRYDYYAPLGAVVATSVTVVGSLRESARASLAIALGAMIALVVGVLLEPGVVMVVCVVALGVLLAGWKPLGDLGTWVPTAALFVLIIGQRHPWNYLVSYVSLVLLGGLIGTVVAIMFPQLPIAPTERAVARLRFALIDQLSELSGWLGSDEAPEADEWSRRYRSMDTLRWDVRQELHRAEESRHGNRRVLRNHTTLSRVSRQARALERTAWLVQDLAEIITEDEGSNNTMLGLGARLRPSVIEMLRALAAVLESVGDEGAGKNELATAQRRIDALAKDVETVRGDGDDGLHVASNVVNSSRRILFALNPPAESSI